MNEQLFEWIIGGLVLIFGAGFSALWVLQLRMEGRLTSSAAATTKNITDWIKKHIEDDGITHTALEKAYSKNADDLHTSEIRALQTFITKADVQEITRHFDQGLTGVNGRLDLMMMAMTPGKQGQ